MIHVMLDLETMGQRPTAPIMQVGLVAYDTENPGSTHQARFNIKLETAVAAGAKMETGTVLWWLAAEADAARRNLLKGQEKADDLASVLVYIRSYFKRFDGRPVLVWGNGANFDNVLLTEAYKRVGEEPPWSFRANMCYRTLKNLLPHIQPAAPPLVSTHHDALDDAIYQMEHLKLLLAALPGDPMVVLPSR